MSRLLEIFRPEKRAVWKKFCEIIEADFVPGRGFTGKDAIKAYHKNWVIVIDTYKQGKRPTFTRIRAEYLNADSFYFRIYRRNLFSNINKMLGMQDIEIGYPAFDKDFIIQGNDERKLKMLFNQDHIRKLISWQPSIHLESEVDNDWMIDEDRMGVGLLSFKVMGIITDLERLHDLYDLFAELLNHLCHIGSAYEDDPDIV